MSEGVYTLQIYVPDKTKYKSLLDKVKLIPTRRYVQPIPPKQWGHWECDVTTRTRELLTQLGFVIIPFKGSVDREKVLPVLPTEHLSHPPPNIDSRARKYQADCVNLIHYFKNKCILAVTMGGGKSLISVSVLRNKPELNPTVILCPATLKLNWQKEIALWSNIKKPKVHILEGRSLNTVPKGTQYLICNYDILWWQLPTIIKFSPKTLIADEAHVLKSDYKYVGKWYPDYELKKNEEIIDKKVYSLPPKVVRATRALVHGHEEWKGIQNILLLTGTPIQNNNGDIFNLLNLLDKDKFKNRQKFEDYFCNQEAGFKQGTTKITGSKNSDILHKLLVENYMIRKTKAEILPELPKTTKSVIPIEIDNRKEYQKAEEDIIKWVLENKKKMIVTTEQERSAKFQTLMNLARNGKLEQCFSFIDNLLESDEKIIIFAYHREIIDMIYERYQKKAVRLYGSTSPKDKDKAVNDFQNDKKIKVFVGQMQSASVGITLTASSTVVFVETGYLAHLVEQACDRANRIGQTADKVLAYFLTASNTIEELIMKKIDTKLVNMEKTVDGVDTDEEDLLTYLYENITEVLDK